MNLNSILSSLDIKNNFYDKVKTYICCMDCRNNTKNNTNMLNNKFNNNESVPLIINISEKRTVNNIRLKKKWLNYHYEILRKCLILFSDDIKKINFFLNEFSEEEIKKKINYYKNYYETSSKRRNQSISTYMDSVNVDLLKNINSDDNMEENVSQDLFSIDEFIFKNSDINTIKSNKELDCSFNSNKTEFFYENKNFNTYIDDEEIDTELNDIFDNNYNNTDLDELYDL